MAGVVEGSSPLESEVEPTVPQSGPLLGNPYKSNTTLSHLQTRAYTSDMKEARAHTRDQTEILCTIALVGVLGHIPIVG